MSWTTLSHVTTGALATATLQNSLLDDIVVLKTSIADDGYVVPTDLVLSKTFANTPYTIGTGNASESHVDWDASGGASTCKLPASPATGRRCRVSKSDSSVNTVTVDGNGKNINGATTKIIYAQYDSLSFYYNGTEWRIF